MLAYTDTPYRMIGLGRLCMCLGAPRGLFTHLAEKLARNFSFSGVILGGLTSVRAYSGMAMRELVYSSLPR